MTDPNAEPTPEAPAAPDAAATPSAQPTSDLSFPKFDEPTTVDPFSLPETAQPDFSAPSDLWELPKPAQPSAGTSYPGQSYQAQAAYAQPSYPQPQPAPAPQPSYPQQAPYAQPSGYPQAPYGQNSGYAQPTGQVGYPEPSGYAGYGQELSTRPQQPYGYGYPMAPDHPSSTVVLVLGLIGMFLFPPTAPFAWVMGSKARAEMAAYPGRWGSSGTLTVGWVLGIITSVIWLLIIGFVLIAIIGLASFS